MPDDERGPLRPLSPSRMSCVRASALPTCSTRRSSALSLLSLPMRPRSFSRALKPSPGAPSVAVTARALALRADEHHCLTCHHDYVVLIGTNGSEGHDGLVGMYRPHFDRRGDRIARIDRRFELPRLAHIDRARPRQIVSQRGRSAWSAAPTKPRSAPVTRTRSSLLSSFSPARCWSQPACLRPEGILRGWLSRLSPLGRWLWARYSSGPSLC